MKVIEELVKLMGHLAWPVFIFVTLFFLRSEIKSAISAFAKRMADPSSDVSIGKEGLSIKSRVDAALGRIESLEIDQNQSKDLILGVLEKESILAPKEHSEVVDPELMKLADEYLQIDAKEWTDRVRLKNESARKMANLVLTRNISKDLLASQAHEGLVMALVSAIHTSPDEKDFDRISVIVHKVSRLHVKYIIAMAIGRIFEQRLAANTDVDRAQEILDLYTIGADQSLRNRIAQTKAIITMVVSG